MRDQASRSYFYRFVSHCTMCANLSIGYISFHLVVRCALRARSLISHTSLHFIVCCAPSAIQLIGRICFSFRRSLRFLGNSLYRSCPYTRCKYRRFVWVSSYSSYVCPLRRLLCLYPQPYFRSVVCVHYPSVRSHIYPFYFPMGGYIFRPSVALHFGATLTLSVEVVLGSPFSSTITLSGWMKIRGMVPLSVVAISSEVTRPDFPLTTV